MADLSFYKYLEAAFRHKLYKDTTASSFKYLDYSLPYESIGGKKGIFEYARKILPKFYTDQFDDTEEGHLQMAKAVLEKLERKQDAELVKQFEGYNVAEDQQVIQEAKEQSGEVSQQAAVGEPARTMAGGGYAPSLPQTPLMRTAPRIYKLPGQLAGKEGGTGEGTAATQKAASLRKVSPAIEKAARFQRDYIGPATAKAARIAGSKAGVFFKRNFGKYITMGRLATGIGAVIGGFAGVGLTGGASMGGLGGIIGGAILPSWVRSGGAGRFFGKAGNGVINFGARLSNQVGKGGLNLAGPKKKVALLFLGSFLLFGLAAGLLGALNPGGTPSPGGNVGTGLSPSANPLQIVKSADKTTTASGEDIKFTIKVGSNSLAGNKVTITEKIPEHTVFVSAESGGTLNGQTIEWNLDAIKNASTNNSFIPPRNAPAPPGYGRPVQRITATVEQLKAELEKNSNDPFVQKNAQHIAQTIYNVGVKHNVDPAFIAAVWAMETSYKTNGPYGNNVGSIAFVRPGYLGMSDKFVSNSWNKWATFDTIEKGIEAIPLLIVTEYYPKGQIDTWTIHSGVDEKHQHAYHGVEHIGTAGQDIQTWEQYVGFHNSWLRVMDRITGGNNFSIDQTLSFVVKTTTDKKWVTNAASGFAPGTGNTSSNQVVIKVGEAPENERPGTNRPAPPAPADKNQLIAEIKNNFNVEIQVDLNTEQLKLIWEGLWAAKNNTTNFFKLLSFESTGFRTIKIAATNEQFTKTDNGSGSILLSAGFRTLGGNLFKQVILHELGHIIHGTSGNPRQKIFDDGLAAAKRIDGDHLTRYHDNLDESFAEIVSYYVLNDMPEQPTLYRDVKWPNVNPLKSGKYPEHLKFIKSILGEPTI